VVGPGTNNGLLANPPKRPQHRAVHESLQQAGLARAIVAPDHGEPRSREEPNRVEIAEALDLEEADDRAR